MTIPETFPVQPQTEWAPKRWAYDLLKLGLNTVGRLSNGIRIGQTYGFDSGVMLDYVYTNRASGKGIIGRAIDRGFLNSKGWRGIRNRGVLLGEEIIQTLDTLYDGQPTRIADLACGGGQYVLDALAARSDIDCDTVLRDYRAENINRAQANAAARGVAIVAERADAFNDTELERLGERDLIIVSGLHEILTDDALIKGHFHQIAKCLRPGGILLQTIQPHHPQLEMIARTLTTHTGKPWAMRLRCRELVVEWARDGGLELVHESMEPLGIFGVLRFRKA